MQPERPELRLVLVWAVSQQAASRPAACRARLVLLEQALVGPVLREHPVVAVEGNRMVA